MRQVAITLILIWFLYSAVALLHLIASLTSHAFAGLVFNPLGMDVDRVFSAALLWFMITVAAAFLKDEVDA